MSTGKLSNLEKTLDAENKFKLNPTLVTFCQELAHIDKINNYNIGPG
jgi:hypothetical protein